MVNKLTYNQIYKILEQANFSQQKDTLEIKYLIKHKYISDNNQSFLLKITDKGEIFINDYKKWHRRIEYYFKDYEFLGSLIIGFTGGLGATLLNVFF